VRAPREGDDWIVLTSEPLPVDAACSFAVRPDCGGLVVFVGTVRDHAPGREAVHALEYEAYAEAAESRLRALASSARRRWPALGRIVLWHRLGRLEVGEASVVVVASAPHREEAFAGARYLIDTLKKTVPIWKREHWAGGADWGTDASEIVEVR
jgi:molybdopterin synthase catalytic subunit